MNIQKIESFGKFLFYWPNEERALFAALFGEQKIFSYKNSISLFSIPSDWKEYKFPDISTFNYQLQNKMRRTKTLI